MSKFDIYETVTNSILEQLEQGLTPWVKPWNNTSLAVLDATLPFNGKTKKNYKRVNVFLLSQ